MADAIPAGALRLSARQRPFVLQRQDDGGSQPVRGVAARQVAPITSASFSLKRPEVIALWDGKSAPQPLATFTQPVQLTGGIGRIKRKMYILATDDPAHFTRFYEKLKNDPAWTVHSLPCTHFIQLEMPDELTAILMKAIP